jgi:uroporphyrin-III C-methyltransferase/precorrin-2 dehydrogenase/sirohydrochlorin ferrochelatase
MRHLPAFLDINDRPGMEVGGVRHAPHRAARPRGRLGALIPAALRRLAALAYGYRKEAQSRLRTRPEHGHFRDRVSGGGDSAVRAALARALINSDAARRGRVYLVGAGPGNPDLLTLRALRLMQQADVVLHDHLVSDAVLELVHADAERIYVGKQESNHALPQEEINALLVRLAGQGMRVLRLKGGDPFMFGRGGEEVEALAAQGIAFEVVPGITSAAGASAYAGIPLTHRDHAQSCVFVTGHRRDGGAEMDWAALARPGQTVVIYMGLGMLPEISRRLVEHGRGADTPAAIIERATTEAQRVLVGTLATLPDLATAYAVKPPALVIVGEVVALRERLRTSRSDAPPARLNLDAPRRVPDPLTTGR